MKLLFTDYGWQTYRYWQEHDLAMVRRIHMLIDDALRSPFKGIGKPEPLRSELSGWWSRRINQEHRLVYRCTGKDDDQRIEIASCRFHY